MREVDEKQEISLLWPNMNIAVTSAGANTVLLIDYIEANAIRYVAGYVVRAVKKKCMR